MVAPRTCVHVEQLECAVAFVPLILELDQAVVLDGAKEASRELLQLWQLDRLDKRACAPKIDGMLAETLRRHAGADAAVLIERAER